MRLDFGQQALHVVPNPFEGGGACLCKCPKWYFPPLNKKDHYFRVAALKAKPLNSVGVPFSFERIVITPENPTGAVSVQSGELPTISILNDMNVNTGFGLRLDTDAKTIEAPDTVTDPNNQSAQGGQDLAPGDPMPTDLFIGKVVNFPASNMPVNIGEEITNDFTGDQCTYFNGVDILGIAGCTVRIVRTGETEISFYLDSEPGTLVPVDYDTETGIYQFGWKFTYIGGGAQTVQYWVKADAPIPVNPTDTVSVNWEIAIDGSGGVDNEITNATAEEWVTPIKVRETLLSDDAQQNGWTPTFTLLSEIVDSYPALIGYTSAEPFFIIGLCDLKNIDGEGGASVPDIYVPDMSLTVSNNGLMQSLNCIFKRLASYDGDHEFTSEIYASFFGESWYGYFENMFLQAEQNEISAITPGMTFETLNSDSSLLYAYLDGLTDAVAFSKLPKEIWDSTDPNLYMPRGMYAPSSFNKLNTYLAAHDGEYPVLWVIQIVS